MRHRYKLLLCILLGLVALEASLRILDSRAGRGANFWLPLPVGTLEFVVPHPFLGFVYRPGADRQRASDGSGQDLHINNLGMRGEDMQPRKPAGVYRILCLGGSTTFGSSVTSDSLTYPARLEFYLNQSAPSGLRYEVGNCGVNGYSTVESLINLQLRLAYFDPDAIIIYHAANDARPILTSGFRTDYTHLRRAWQTPHVHPIDAFLLERSRTWCWITRGLDPEEQYRSLSHPLFVQGFKDLHEPYDELTHAAGIDTFIHNLRLIVSAARELGIEPVLSTFATCESNKKPESESFLPAVAAMNQRMVRFARSLEVPVLRVAEALDGKSELFAPGDWMHLNDAGSDRHGHVVFREARRLSLFRQ